MPQQINHGDYTKIAIQLPNGSVAVGEVGSDGYLYLYNQNGSPIDKQGNPRAGSPQPGSPMAKALADEQAQAQKGTAQQKGNGAGGDEPVMDRNGRPMPDGNIPKDATFRQRLTSILKDNKFDRVIKGRKRGKLDLTSLPKAAMNSNSIFKQKQARKNKAYNIVLAIDESGSMHGRQFQEAAMTAGFLADNFMGIDLDIAVVGFSSRVHVRKSFDQSMTAQTLYKTLIRDFSSGGTDDYGGLVKSYELLKGKEGAENIVIMLTDGEGDRSADEMHTLVRRNAHLAKTYGIGIGTPARNIPQNVMAKNLDELKPLVLNILKQSVSRG